jgi:hypothetical protein
MIFVKLSVTAVCRYVEFSLFSFTVQCVIMLSVVLLSVMTLHLACMHAIIQKHKKNFFSTKFVTCESIL